jgi:molybdenum cofactor biosynthesis enzyme
VYNTFTPLTPYSRRQSSPYFDALEQQRSYMVDIGKNVTSQTATASGRIVLNQEAFDLLLTEDSRPS